jgi:DNA helicase IV
MRDIVATIQAEQDEIIRLDHPEVLVIKGGPGTGKTVVAAPRHSVRSSKGGSGHERSAPVL